MGDTLVRAIGSEVQRLSRKEVDWSVEIVRTGYADFSHKALIKLPYTGFADPSIAFSAAACITVDQNDQLLFDHLEFKNGHAAVLVAITFQEDHAMRVKAYENAYQCWSMQYNIAKAISREIIGFAEKNGMKITRVDRLELPKLST